MTCWLKTWTDVFYLRNEINPEWNNDGKINREIQNTSQFNKPTETIWNRKNKNPIQKQFMKQIKQTVISNAETSTLIQRN
jgi:hypothetical protein